jgi:hypothetical protein
LPALGRISPFQLDMSAIEAIWRMHHHKFITSCEHDFNAIMLYFHYLHVYIIYQNIYIWFRIPFYWAAILS